MKPMLKPLSTRSAARAAPRAEAAPGFVQGTVQLGGMTVQVSEVAVGQARTEIPSLIRDSAETGRAFHIRNAKNPAAASALLVSPQALEKLVFAPVRQRTLGDLLDALPFKHTGARGLRAKVADNRTRRLRVPGTGGGAKP